jgi:hypothetical protein
MVQFTSLSELINVLGVDGGGVPAPAATIWASPNVLSPGKPRPKQPSMQACRPGLTSGAG